MLVLFDGVCVLCHRTVQFLIQADKKGVLQFAALQGRTGAALLTRHPEIEDASRSVIVVRNLGLPSEETYLRAKAILAICSEIGGLCRLASVFKIVPTFMANRVYDFVAQHRYAWFGRYEECFFPDSETKERFLD